MSQFGSPLNQPEQSETESLRTGQPETESLRWERIQHPSLLGQRLSFHLQAQHPMQEQSELPPVETMTKVYTKARDFRKDRKLLAKAGWTVAKSSSYQPQRGSGQIIALGMDVLFKPRTQIIVEYSRRVSPIQSHLDRR
jgi:hypothetical protein